MARHFQKELEKVKKMILSLGAMVEERVRQVWKGIEGLDPEIATRIIKTDHEVDEMEVEIEEECLKIMALHQPVAIDLRFLIAVIKINNDLERIADETVNIAERIATLDKYRTSKFFFDYEPMASTTEEMLKLSLDALVNMDVDLAFKVVTMDDEVDDIHRQAYRLIRDEMKNHPDLIVFLMNYYLISRHLERIADHATNIAEEVIYLIEGEIVRHASY
ncbi:MAG: phosphate signaling complex protein PhoU [Desulfobacterales bacterium]|nr:phosphate signaling complex protein PhoU [Desulfobacterales bacterium]MDJ0873680.1 phosphate signaling complex protein PhoU [Desulfobacterales bacterium]